MLFRHISPHAWRDQIFDMNDKIKLDTHFKVLIILNL